MRTGCLPSKTQQSIRRIGTSRNSTAAARYLPRQPLNLQRCDNVDAAFCMLDCCRIHSRFPSPLPPPVSPLTVSIRPPQSRARVSKRIRRHQPDLLHYIALPSLSLLQPLLPYRHTCRNLLPCSSQSLTGFIANVATSESSAKVALLRYLSRY